MIMHHDVEKLKKALVECKKKANGDDPAIAKLYTKISEGLENFIIKLEEEQNKTGNRVGTNKEEGVNVQEPVADESEQ